MTKRYRNPEDPEVLEAVLERIRQMTRDEWLQELSWRPAGVQETWRMQRPADGERPNGLSPSLMEHTSAEPKALNPELISVAREPGRS